MNIFYQLGKLSAANFDNLFATLEGGYNIEIFPKCLHNFIDGINGNEMKFSERSTDSMIQTFYEFEGRKAMALQHLRKYWKSI